jgi:hypothetical protein
MKIGVVGVVAFAALSLTAACGHSQPEVVAECVVPSADAPGSYVEVADTYCDRHASYNGFLAGWLYGAALHGGHYYGGYHYAPRGYVTVRHSVVVVRHAATRRVTVRSGDGVRRPAYRRTVTVRSVRSATSGRRR